jgi:RNA polymerase sigma-54 factor
MGKATKLGMETIQQQRLTPLQVRYVRTLEMTGPEFEADIRNALEENPALEVKSQEDEEHIHDLTRTEDGASYTESSAEMQRADYGTDDDIPDYLSNKMYASTQEMAEDYYEPVVVAGDDSMCNSLMLQLNELDITEDERKIAEYIIGSLDDNGYLTTSLQSLSDDIAYATGNIYSVDVIRSVWEKVRQLDPPGIAAVDLRDCMILQLKRLPRTVENLTALEMVKDYFDLFSKKHTQKIAASMGIEESQVRDAWHVISRLNPKPASLLESTGGGSARAVVPEFYVEVDDDETITLRLLNKVPELCISESFAADVTLPDASPRSTNDANVFLKQKRDEATDYIKIVGMRQQTLFKVMSAIIKIQRQFFLTEDESQIRPMVLRELADATGLDLSVVSRATRERYVMTDNGVYPLKMFFNERRKKSSGADDSDDNTTPKIIAAIKDIIEQEDKKKPLSDDQITKMLTEKGFDIARRTVAKYRERLGFPVCRLRKTL